MRDYIDIIRRNLLSPIVIAIFVLAGALLYVREYRDAWFISVVIVINSLIGIIQEIRAKRALRKLELLSAPKARVVQGDAVVEVSYDALALGNVVELRAGDEVPADIRLASSSGLEVNESMLTGESVAVEKRAGDLTYAATTVVAGTARGKVVAIGDVTKAGAISAVLKRYTPEITPLQRAIRQAITFATFGAVGIAGVIYLVYFLMGEDAIVILKTIVSAAVTMVPEGLLLASSLLLAFGSVKLAQAKVLPQKLAAIEAMALLNILCVDKTGTLTSDTIELDRLVVFHGKKKQLSDAAAIVAHEASGANATGDAIETALAVPQAYIVRDIMAFSSARKMSAARIELGGKTRTFFLGAPEYISTVATVAPKHASQIAVWTKEGLRVLLVAEIDDMSTPLKEIQGVNGTVLGAVVLSNSLRQGVPETVDFLQRRGCEVRVISGDNPQTVSYVASAAGIARPHAIVTGADLAAMDDEAFARAADEHTIFARVLPEQKEQLIAHFRAEQRFTGMVGDGVNDALALKEADLGVAMHAGAPASRRVADIVLLNNSFTSLPMGMKLGNQIMHAIEVIATLFFHKIIYGFVLLVTTMLLGMTYPFAPRHITFMNIFLVTLPTLMWTVFPPVSRRLVNPKRFWRNTLVAVAPIAILTGLTVTFTYWIMSMVYPQRPMHVATMTVLTATFFGVYMVFLVARLAGVTANARAKKARIAYIVAVVCVASTSFGVGFLRDFFDFSLPTVWILWPAVGVIVLVAIIQWQMMKSSQKNRAE